MRAGLLNRRVQLQSFALSSNGDPTSGTWTTTHTVYAQKMDKGSVERFATDQELAESASAYRVRYLSDIDPTWRLVDGGDIWDIEGVLEGGGYKEESIVLVSRYDPEDA